MARIESALYKSHKTQVTFSESKSLNRFQERGRGCWVYCSGSTQTLIGVFFLYIFSLTNFPTFPLKTPNSCYENDFYADPENWGVSLSSQVGHTKVFLRSPSCVEVNLFLSKFATYPERTSIMQLLQTVLTFMQDSKSNQSLYCCAS